MALPSTPTNLFHHVWAHLQLMLWKVADHQAPPDKSFDVTIFGLEIQHSVPVPVIAKRPNEEGKGHEDVRAGLADPDYELEDTDVVAKDIYRHHIK